MFVCGLLLVVWIDSAFVSTLVAGCGYDRLGKAMIGGGRIEFELTTTYQRGFGEFDCGVESTMEQSWLWRLGLVLPHLSAPRFGAGPGTGIVQTLPKSSSGTLFSIMVPFWLMLVVAGLPTLILWYRDRPPREGYCDKCGYNLTGNTSGTCPECGEPISNHVLPRPTRPAPTAPNALHVRLRTLPRSRRLALGAWAGLAGFTIAAWIVSYVAPRPLPDPPERRWTWASEHGAVHLASRLPDASDMDASSRDVPLPGIQAATSRQPDRAAIRATAEEEGDSEMSLPPPPDIVSRVLTVEWWLPFVLVLAVAGLLGIEVAALRRRRTRESRCLRCGAVAPTADADLCDRCRPRAAAPEARRARSDAMALPRWWRPVTILAVAGLVISGVVCVWSYVRPIELRTGPPGSQCRYDAGQEAWTVQPAGELTEWLAEPHFSSYTQYRHTVVALHRGRLQLANLDTISNAFLRRPVYEPVFVYVWQPVHSYAKPVPICHVPWCFGGLVLLLLAYARLVRSGRMRRAPLVGIRSGLRWLGLAGLTTVTVAVAAAYGIALFYNCECMFSLDNQACEVSIAMESGALRATIKKNTFAAPAPPTSPWTWPPSVLVTPATPEDYERWYFYRSALGLDALVWWPSYGRTTDPSGDKRWDVHVPMWIPLFVWAFPTALLWSITRRPATGTASKAAPT